jgi:hypothetical protein
MRLTSGIDTIFGQLNSMMLNSICLVDEDTLPVLKNNNPLTDFLKGTTILSLHKQSLHNDQYKMLLRRKKIQSPVCICFLALNSKENVQLLKNAISKYNFNNVVVLTSDHDQNSELEKSIIDHLSQIHKPKDLYVISFSS